MKIPLRERFSLLILPLIAIQFLCFLAIIVPSLTIPADLRRLELHLRQRTLTASLARLLDEQAKTCVDFVLRRDDADRRRIEDLQGRARNTLARWQALKRPEDALTAEEVRSTSEIERDSGRINQLIGEIVDRAAAGGADQALDRIRQELAPLLARLEGEEDSLIETEGMALLETMASARGRLAVANLATSGKFALDLDATRSDVLRGFAADQFARRLSQELFLYALTAAVGRREPGIEAVREGARDALDTWRKLVENHTSSNQTREAAALTGIERGYSRIAETGVQLLSLVGAGRRSEAVEVLTWKLDPIAENQISPLVDQVVATDAAEIEVGLAMISSRLRWVFGVLGAVSLLGLAIGLGSPLLIDRQIIRPIVRMRGLATRLGAGDLYVRALVDSDDEVGELAAAFNQMAADLESRTREMRVLGELGDHLQACMTVDEACQVLIPSARALFPDDSGCILVFAPSRDILEPVVAWGNASTPPSFAPDECWAVRRGRLQAVTGGSRAVRCQHVPAEGDYLCCPMSAQGEMLGVLHVQLAPSGAGAFEGPVEAKQRVVLSVADQFAQALANLRLRETLRGLSIRDPLTGLFNRRYLEESLDRELRRAERRSLPVAILMLDVDQFKHFNETFGHEAGDLVLKEVAMLLKRNSRAEDIACRYGGEEFTLILPEMTLEHAKERAQQINEAVRQLRVLQGQQFLGPVTISVGVAIFPTDGSNARDVLRAADGALYRAKQCGRDRVEVVA
ncbi:MAG TPA: diguanylate cyclase [Thermoanaerobaculia bacterium]